MINESRITNHESTKMGYQSRKRGYKSRREKFQHTVRNTRIILIFLSIGLLVWMFRNRYEFWGWLQTYFY